MRIEYEGGRKVAKYGLISGTKLATTRARLVTADAQIQRAAIEQARTQVRGPFAGLVEKAQVEVGDFLQPGTACATIIDLDPMMRAGRVAERNVQKLKLAATAHRVLIEGTEVQRKLTVIAQQSDTAASAAESTASPT